MKSRVLSLLLAAVLAVSIGLAGCAGEERPQHSLTISSTEGGSVTKPGEGTFTYNAGEKVNLVAIPDEGYQFVSWAGDIGTLANLNTASTTITMNDDYSITANFAVKQYSLAIHSTEGGSVTVPGEGVRSYNKGEVVNLVATPDAGYRFVSWTGDVGTIADVSAASTSITIYGDYSITAVFQPSGPVSWWRAEGDANDSCGSNHGVLMNGAAFGTGKVGQAFRFDGVDDWVMVASAPDLNFGTKHFTVCLWVNFADPDPEQVMIEKYVETFGSPERIGWTFTKLTSSIVRLHVGPGPWSVLDAPASITANTWHFAAVSRSGDEYRIYWDGNLVGSITLEGMLNLDSDVSLKIGHRGNPDDTPGSVDERNFYLKGLVDEVQIYAVALSDADIVYMFNNPGATPGSLS